MCWSCINGPTGRKRAPGSTGGMQQCQNHCQAWHILQCAQSSRSDRKEEKFGEKSGKLRSRCGFARTQAFWHGWHGIFCRARSGLQRHSHTDTQRHAHRLSFSQLQPGIVRVRVAKVFWAMAQLPHASLSVQCKRPQHGVESGVLSEPLS